VVVVAVVVVVVEGGEGKGGNRGATRTLFFPTAEKDNQKIF